ncbi:PIG-L deacetylase family protein [Arsenicicoccus dermatophilus]|uniref:PIG-L deacetylase family protein n=1 Tax=Arsenicicoccus dermatophilus TaxID=1076331 RepID=UPI001F4CCB62|nr:PIG-L family deacetylase [Arsenicicoccus dermatophilus]MCH8614201.1 PIG-L family deacetylase [Arsenicicoccus dermatophilus]
MSTVVFLHAHPDDEASQTSGSMARAAREGHRVVVVYGTDGDHGEVPDDLGDESLVAYRRREAEASARVTGTQRVAWLGYADSGMTGWEQNSAEGAFSGADLDEAAGRLAALLDEEDADVLVGYDWHGGYGHPDHVMVHRVAHRAAELAARHPRLLESTMSRDHLRRTLAQAVAAGLDERLDPDQPMDDGNPFGTPEAEIHWKVDVRDLVETKRAALACHASQRTDIGMFLAMPVEAFTEGFGYEWAIEPGRAPGMVEGWWLDEPVPPSA